MPSAVYNLCLKIYILKFIFKYGGVFIGIEIGEHFIPYYGLFIVIGIAVAALIGAFQVKRFKKDINDFIVLSAFTALGSIIGAKILYLLINWKNIDMHRITNMDYLNGIMSGGFVFYGGVLGGILFLILSVKLFRINSYEYADICMPCIPVVHGFGRLGCSAVGCCYGVPFHGIGAVIYHDSPFAPNDIPLFPVQSAEAVIEFFIALILIIYIDCFHRAKINSVYLYLLLYAPFRFGLEFYRWDAERGSAGCFSTSQWISVIILIVIGGRFMLQSFIRQKKFASGKE